MSDQVLDRAALLRPYLPRLQIQWLTEAPGTIFRELEGTVVFVDISGFTKMSERLARKGKVGAEEVTEVLGAVFSQLLAIAYGLGGGLIKFGGDALLMFFGGEEHALRAVTAAFGMRRTLREIGELDTSAGRITLRMSVGIHSGVFQFFLVGDSHREFMISGPAASETVHMEGTATAGEILLSEATAAAIPTTCLGRPKGGGTLLRKAPGGLVTFEQEPELSVVGVDLAACVPLAVREHLLAGRSEPEHRQVTVAFIHYDGVDAMVREQGPEAVAFALDALVTDVQMASDKHGVAFLASDIDHDGGKIILTAGAPNLVGDDEERMLLALRSILEAELAIPARIGVNRGPVFAGEIGPPYRRTYTVMGDAVNLAARVMAKAESGQLLATSSVLDPSPVEFETNALEPFMVKGKKKAVRAFSVGPVVGTKHIEEGDELPLVGREEEVAILLDALDQARGGRGLVLEIVGPPGIGKSRLLAELRAAASECRVLSAACELYHASTAYRPIRMLLHQILEVPEDAPGPDVAERLRERVEALAPDLVPWIPLLAMVLDVDVPRTEDVDQLSEDFRKPRLEQTVEDFLARTLTEATVFALEDVHWMDAVSCDLLTRLSQSAGVRPWLICVTRRAEETGFVALPDDRSTSLHPMPLSEADAETLLTIASEDSPLRPDEITVLAGRSGGNPLFLKELLSALRGALSVGDLPSSIEALVMAQIDRLSPQDRRLLRYASVLGSSFTDDLIAALMEGENAQLDPGIWRRLGDFLTQDGPGLYRFRHALMRDAAYEGLPFRRRRELHARAAETIVRLAEAGPEEFAELLSLHFFFAQRHGEAWAYSRIAADRGASKYANSEAAMFYERAIDSARRVSVSARELASMYEALGDVKWRIGAFGDASAAFGAARRLVEGQAVAQAKVLLKEAKIPYKAGRYSHSIRWVRRGLHALEGIEGDEAARERVQLMAFYAALRAAQGRYVEAERSALDVVREAGAAGEKGALAHAYVILDFVYMDTGRVDEAVFSPKALAIHEERGDLFLQAEVLNNMGVDAYDQGNWDIAIERYERARGLRLKIGDADGAAEATSNMGEILSDQGHLDEAEKLFREALRVFRASHSLAKIALAVGNLGRVASRAGRFDEALPMLRDAVALFEEVGDQSLALENEARIAELHLFRGDWPEAMSGVDEALRKAETRGGMPLQVPMLHRVRAYSLMRLGRPDDARKVLEASLGAARSRSSDYEAALTLKAMCDLAALGGTLVEPGLDGERASLFDRLGIVRLPEIPLAAMP